MFIKFLAAIVVAGGGVATVGMGSSDPKVTKPAGGSGGVGGVGG